MTTPAERDFLKLLMAFQGLPPREKGLTFMDVAGYPHYENVISNILGFYLDPKGEHGLGTLMLSALLRMTGDEGLRIPVQVQVTREHHTEEGKRIDLIVDCDSFTVGVENKIFHWEANDLDQYGREIDRIGENKRKIKILLLLQQPEKREELGGGFKRYTHRELWCNVRELLGNHISNGDIKWVGYLIDLMKNIANLAGENMELNEADRFFIDNSDLIERLLSERNAFYGRLQAKVAALSRLVSETEEARKLVEAPWIWEKTCLVLDFRFENKYKVSFDAILGPKGWEIQLFGRDSASTGYVTKLVQESPIHTMNVAFYRQAPFKDGHAIVIQPR